MDLLIIVYVLALIIFFLIGFAVFQIKSAGMKVKDFWTFVKANQTLDSLALKYLTVENNGEWLENIDEFALGALFNNELAIIEISAQFQNRIKDFLQSLPTFQLGNQTAKRNK